MLASVIDINQGMVMLLRQSTYPRCTLKLFLCWYWLNKNLSEVIFFGSGFQGFSPEFCHGFPLTVLLLCFPTFLLQKSNCQLFSFLWWVLLDMQYIFLCVSIDKDIKYIGTKTKISFNINYFSFSKHSAFPLCFLFLFK